MRCYTYTCWNLIGSVIVRVVTSSAVDHEFETQSDQTKDQLPYDLGHEGPPLFVASPLST